MSRPSLVEENLSFTIQVFLQFPFPFKQEEIRTGRGQGYLVFAGNLTDRVRPGRVPDEIPEDLSLPEGEIGDLLDQLKGFCFFLLFADDVFLQVFQRPA